VLGPLRVRDAAGRDVTPDGPLQRRLLALLVLRRGRVVSADAAVDALWPRQPPRDPAAALQNHVSRLRRSLPAGVIGSAGDGYRLDPAGVAVDADRLTSLMADDGADDSAGHADGELDAVLARWHGPAYPELADLDDGRAEAVRLEELRVRAREVRAERRLAAGATNGELVAELLALVDTEPLRERPVALLMTALLATGRRVDALRVYDDFRRRVGDELGVEPSPVLADQHAALLEGRDREPAAPAGGSVPVAVASLVGRDELVEALVAAVQEHRVVTLVGPGGVGKTRVLVELGRRLRAASAASDASDDGDDGDDDDGVAARPVALCELAPADDASAIDAVAAALGVDARPGVGPVDRVAAVLGDGPAVLLVDNCEHVLGPVAALVEQLTARCPGVVVVATSRERLRVPGEQVWPVPPLDAEGADSTAARLFVERARAVAADFDPGPDDRAVVAEVVRRLDGLPLAIELAAARLLTHDIAEVAEGLDHRFALLRSGARTSTRHGSLGAAVSWSFDLLDPDLQRAFADLSVFVGSFTAADTAAVVGVDRVTASALLAELGERSLVGRAPGRRWVLLETLRAFGAEQLRETGRHDEVARRHAHHQVAWVGDADRRLEVSGGTAVAEIDAAVPELRAALDWLLDHGEVEPAGRMVVTLFSYGFLRLRPDVLAWAEAVTRADPHDRSAEAAEVWVSAAYAAWMVGDMAGTRARRDRAQRVAGCDGDSGGDADMPAGVAGISGACAMFDGDVDDAARWYGRAAALAAAHGDRAYTRFAGASELLALGYGGDPAAADRATDLLARTGDDDTAHAAYAWYCAGEAVLEVDVDVARTRFTRALEVAARTHASLVTGLAGTSRASIDARVGDPRAAADDYRRLIAHWRRAGMWATQWTMLRSIAGLLARLGRPRDAAVLEGAVRHTESGHRIFGADEVALAALGAALRSELGDDDYEAARREGAALDGDAAVEHALRSLAP